MNLNEIQNLLSSLCPEIEKALEPHLRGLIRGPLVRSQLPQTWNFKTEKEDVTFHLDKQGNAVARSGQVSNPDVTIEWGHDYLSLVLDTRSSRGIPPGEKPKVTLHTSKGQQGYNILKKRIGL